MTYQHIFRQSLIFLGCLIALCFVIAKPATALLAAPERVFPSIFPTTSSSPTQATCIVAGCSGQLCVDANVEPLMTTCEWREEYACYQSAECKRQTDGSCGWTQTKSLQSCLEKVADTIDSPVLKPSPAACNGICEANDVCHRDTICVWEGACPSDCPNGYPPLTKPSPTSLPDTANNASRCEASGGTWEIFSNGCADQCSLVGQKPGSYACTQATMESCQCGPDSCWDGSSCVSNPLPLETTPTDLSYHQALERFAHLRKMVLEFQSRLRSWGWGQ